MSSFRRLFSGAVKSPSVPAPNRSRVTPPRRRRPRLESLEARRLLAADLFISEYVEGTSNNKAIELYNPTAAPIDMTGYRVQLFSNGRMLDNPTSTLDLTATIPAGGTFVIVNGSAGATLAALGDVASAVTNFNGDDAVILAKQNASDPMVYDTLDVFGVVGDDPGTEWSDNGVGTLNKTLRRKPTITMGNLAGFVPLSTLSAEWNQFDIDTFDGLGSHTIIAGNAIGIVATDASKLEGDSGTTPFTFTVTRSGDTSAAMSVNFAVTGTVDAADFSGILPGGVLNFTAGQASQVLTLNVSGDTTIEPSEKFTVTLSAPSDGATLTTATADGTIIDDDAPIPNVKINEIRIEQPGPDDDEYFELTGLAGASLDALTYIVVGPATAGGSGVIESITPLIGQTIPADRYFLAGQAGQGDVLGVTTDASLPFNFRGGSANLTHLLVSNFTGTLNADLDTNDDGVLDVTPWTSILDSVALVDDLANGQQVYSANRVGPDAGDFTPGHVFRAPDVTGPFQFGAFIVEDSNDTPGVANVAGPAIPDIYLNELLFNPPGNLPGTGDEPNEYIELRGPAGSTIPTGTYLINIEGDTSTGSTVGDVTDILDLSGLTFGSNGYLVFLQQNSPYVPDPAATTLLSTAPGYSGLPGNIFQGDPTNQPGGGNQLGLENASNSILLVRTTAPPTLTTDGDTNDDGILDIAGWTIVDGVSVVDGDASDVAYAPVVFRTGGGGGSTSTGTAVGEYVGRIGNSIGMTAADWVAAELAGSAPAWTLQNGRTTPASMAGRALNHVGLSNAFDLTGITVTPSGGGNLVVEGGTTDTFTVALATQPVADVTVNLTADAELTLDLTLLTFTNANWNVPQTVTVTAFDDTDKEGDHIGLISVTVVTSDPDYATLPPSSITFNVGDNDIPSTTNAVINEFVVDDPAAGVDPDAFIEIFAAGVTEETLLSGLTLLQIEGDFSAGSSVEGSIVSADTLGLTDAAGYFVVNRDFQNGSLTMLLVSGFTGTSGQDLDTNDDGVLDVMPWTAIVDSVAITDGGATDLFYAGAPRLTGTNPVVDRFRGASRIPNGTDTDTTADWVRNDPDGAGLPSYPAVVATAGEAINTPGLPNRVAVSTAGVSVTPTNGSTDISEDGVSDTFNVVLTERPDFDVTVTLIFGDGQTFVNQPPLTFNSTNWNLPQTVTLFAVDDDVIEGTHTGVVQFSVASADLDYNGITVGNLTANITDNDFPDLTPPAVQLIVPSLTKVTDLAVGLLDFQVTYNEPMDTTVDPVLSFPTENPSSSIAFWSGVWLTDEVYIASYTFMTSDEIVPNVDVRVIGGRDASGNDQQAYTQGDVFSIDTVGTIIAHDLLNSTFGGLIAFANDSRAASFAGGEAFGKYGGSLGPIPDALIDNSRLTDPNDTLGVIPEANRQTFFGILDTRNPVTGTTPVVATWEFDIDGFTDVSLLVDLVAMGDFEADDTLTLSYQIDGGIEQTALQILADESGSVTYTLAGGTTQTLDDPLRVGATTLTNVLQTFETAIAASGNDSVLTVKLTANVDGLTEAIALQNLLVKGELFVPTPPTVTDVMINDGGNSRSQITSVTVTFDRLLNETELADAFTLVNIDHLTNNEVSSLIVTPSRVAGSTVATLTFGAGNLVVNRVGTGILGNSLANGNYRLTIDRTKIVTIGTNAAAMVSDFEFGGQTAANPANDDFFRLLADTNGDGLLNNADLASVVRLFTSPTGYQPDLDSNGDGVANNADLAALITAMIGTGRR